MLARFQICLLVLFALALCPVRALAQEQESAPSADQCLEHHKQGQVLRRQGELGAAAKRLHRCLHPGCSSLLRMACGKLLDEVEADTPSIVLAAQSDGRDLVAVTVYDGETRLTKRLTGRALELDPGVHRLRFETPGQSAVKRTIVLRVGERNRLVTALFEPEEVVPVASQPPALSVPSRKPAAEGASWTVWDYTPFAVGAAAGLSGLFLAITAKNEFDEAEETCAPACSKDRRGSIRTKAWIADGLLVLSGAAFAYGTIRIITRDTASDVSASLVIGPGYLGGTGRF